MENVVEQYLRNIDQFIKSNADSKKIDNIKLYLKNQAEIIYGIPMKRLKNLFQRHLVEFDNLDAKDTFSLIDELLLSKAFEKQVISCMLLERYYYKFDENKIVSLIQEYILNNIIINWAIADQIAVNTFSHFEDKSF